MQRGKKKKGSEFLPSTERTRQHSTYWGELQNRTVSNKIPFPGRRDPDAGSDSGLGFFMHRTNRTHKEIGLLEKSIDAEHNKIIKEMQEKKGGNKGFQFGGEGRKKRVATTGGAGRKTVWRK